MNLSHCTVSGKAVNSLASALITNKLSLNSLTYLNLSGNSLRSVRSTFLSHTPLPVNQIGFALYVRGGVTCNLQLKLKFWEMRVVKVAYDYHSHYLPILLTLKGWYRDNVHDFTVRYGWCCLSEIISKFKSKIYLHILLSLYL